MATQNYLVFNEYVTFGKPKLYMCVCVCVFMKEKGNTAKAVYVLRLYQMKGDCK